MRIPAILAALCLLIVAGCGKQDKEQKNPSKGISITEDGMSVKTEDGSLTVGKGADVPADFPKDVPVYKGAEILMAMQVAKGHQLQLKTDDDVGKVAETYLKSLSDQAWAKQNTMDTGQQKVFSFTKDQRQLTLAIGQQSEATHIMLVVMKTQ